MTSKLLENPKALCNIIRRIAYDAGQITLDYFDEGGFQNSQIKTDGSPVTEADQKTEKFIKEALADITPGIPFIGEETIENLKNTGTALKEDQETYWCVDPIDGTKDFIAGQPDYTVNIALIRNGSPTIGVIYAPAHGELYAGCGEKSAVRWLEETDSEKEIRALPPTAAGCNAVISKRASDHKNFNAGTLSRFLENFKLKKTLHRSSSIKFCLLASGKADIYPCFGRTCQWDTAAGHAILNAAGGKVQNVNGTALTYYMDPKKGFYNPSFVASSFDFQMSDITAL